MPHGDFSLNPFAHGDSVVRVLMQQGRVSLDSDLNAAHAAHIHYLRALATDVIGPHGGNGFEISTMPNNETRDVAIGGGHYWVYGLLCENNAPPRDTGVIMLDPNTGADITPEAVIVNRANFSTAQALTYRNQPWYPWTEQEKNQTLLDRNASLLLYLDVWERNISAAEDDSIRESALGGPDTTTRSIIVWQLRSAPISGEAAGRINKAMGTKKKSDGGVTNVLRAFFTSSAALRADVPPNQRTQPCTIPPDSRYRGAENQLYRVEVHHGNSRPALENPAPNANDAPTFKWDRDNGSAVYRINSIAGAVLNVDSLGYDERTTLSIGDWVEVVDNRSRFLGEVQDLTEVVDINRSALQVTVKDASKVRQDGVNPILRRWSGGADKPITESAADASGWINLEDGVRIQFQPAGNFSRGWRYRPGDYWVIPARVATGKIIWPEENGKAVFVPPHGVDHYFAPLAMWDSGNLTDLRRLITPVAGLP